jgi:hemerythrin superfamily protein
MDIYNYLKKDHRKVSELMQQVLAARMPARRKSLFEEIKHELLLHAETEQATFYAALENEQETEEWIEEAKDEHQEMKMYLNKISRLAPESIRWMEQFGEFKHAVEHHVKEEEETIFEKARDILSREEAMDLAQEMDELKKKMAMRKVA